jgi:hypothetical protein
MVEKYIKHELTSEFEEVNWGEMRKTLRSHLSTLVQRIFTNRSCLESRIRSDGQKKVDTRMYSGSGGVLFALHRFILLLKQEKSAGMAPDEKPTTN